MPTRLRRGIFCHHGLLILSVLLIWVTISACSKPTGPEHAEPSPTPPVASPNSEAAQLARLLGTELLPRSGGAFGASRTVLVPGAAPDGAAALRVNYPAGSASPRAERTDGSVEGGAQVYLILPAGPVDSLHLRYCVRFPSGFNFVKGGKLPGLFGGTVTSGRDIPDGTDGWSTRYMWRRGGTGEVYAYLPASVDHGTSIGRGSWAFTPGRWQCLEQAVRLNRPGQTDGSIIVWVDGREVLKQRDIVFRTTSLLRIDGVFFSTFFGGGDDSWASPTDQHVDFADFSFGDSRLSPI